MRAIVCFALQFGRYFLNASIYPGHFSYFDTCGFVVVVCSFIL